MAGSSLLLDEYFASGDERLLAELLQSTDAGKLGSLAEKLYDDVRPFARKVLLAYVDDGCARSTHRVFVKRLFKRAEAKGDDELMAHFLVAFDRNLRREVRNRWQWDPASRRSFLTQELVDPRHIPKRFRGELSKTTGGQVRPADAVLRSWNGFTRATRRYLQRRALRYFRRLWKDQPRFRQATARALALYKDEHLAKPTWLLDAWGLMHLCFRTSSALRRGAAGITVVEGHSLAELKPTPLNLKAWLAGGDELFSLLAQAQARPVRTWAIGLLEHLDARQSVPLSKVPLALLKPLLKSPHPEVQTFSAKLLQKAESLATLPVHEWLELLKIDHPEALPLLCEAVKKHVHRDRLSLAQCVELAQARAAPVAELGLEWSLARPPPGLEGLKQLMPLVKSECPSVRAKAAQALAGMMEKLDATPPELVRELLDSKHETVRAAGLELMTKVSRFGEATELWMAMSETPYADVRERLLHSMETRVSMYGPATLERLWATTLLSVHRGSRAKRQAALQVSERLAQLMRAPETAQQAPKERASLLKLMGHVLRSVRGPERVAALGSLSRACFTEPKLRAAVEAALPELKLSDEVAA